MPPLPLWKESDSVANREEYRFDVNANTEQATQAVDNLINKFSKLERTINRINKKGFDNNQTTNQKDMDKSMRSYATMAKQMRDASKYIQGSINKAYRDIEKMQAPKKPRKPNKPHEPAPIRSNARKEVRDEYNKNMEKYKRRQANYEKRDANYQAQLKAWEKEKAIYDKRVQEKEKFIQRMISSDKELNRILNNSKKAHQQTQGYEQNYSKNFDHKLSRNGLYNMPPNPEEATRNMKALFQGNDPLETSNNNVKETLRNVQRLRRRNDSLSRRGAAAGALSYQQAKNFHDDYITSQTKYNDMREANFKHAGSLGIQRSRLQQQIDEIEQNPEKYGDDGYHKKIGFQRNIEAIDEEIQNRNRLNAELEKTMVEMQEYRDRLTNNNVSVDAKRGSFARNMSERSAAIGLAMGGTIAGTFVNLYSQGRSVDQATRDQEIYFGQSSGMNGKGWTNWESNLFNQSKNNHALGFTPQQQMTFMNDYLQNAGFHGVGDISSAVGNMGRFSRATGIDANTTASFFGTMAQTGGMNGGQMKDFQDAFVGAIKETGMEGRQQQQLQALQSIVQNVGADKQLSNSQVNSIVGLQGLLASSGNRSLQGQSGADFMNQMNSGIQNGFFNNQMRLIFGAGTKFQGGAGMWQLEKQMNAGIVGKEGLANLQTMTGYAMANGGSSKGMQNYAFSQMAHQMGMNLTTDQIEAFMNMAREGKLTEANVKKFEDNAKKVGAKQSAKNSNSYGSSDAATNNQSEATSDVQAKALYDNTKILRQVNISLGKLPWMMYGLGMAGGALTGMMATTLGSFGFSTIIKNAATGKFGSSIGNLAEYTNFQKFGNKFFGGKFKAPEDRPTPPGGGPTAPGEAAPGFHNAHGPEETETLGPRIRPNIDPKTGMGEKTGNWFTRGMKSAGGDVAKFFGENPMGKAIGKGLGGAFRLAGKLAMPLAIAGGVYDVATAKKGHHVQAAGKAAGAIGGMWAGGEAGAAIGTAFGGPIGTVVGGLVGGGLGALAGSGIGNWIGKGAQGAWNGITGLFKPHKAYAAELKPSDKTRDTHNTNVKAQTEDKRTTNIQTETANLGQQAKQITALQQLLAQARQQNGIIGSLTGMGGGGGAAGGAGMTNAKGNQASIWNYFAQQGYSSSAISGILGNLGTETGGTFDPTTKQKGGPGIGLAQWSKNGRWKQLEAYAKKNGLDPYSMQAQLGFMSQEMGQMGLTPSAMNGLSTSQATALFEQKYEAAGKPNMGSRNNYANSAYNQFANSPQATANAYGGTSGGGTHTINSNINVNLHANGDVAQQLSTNSALQSVGDKIKQMIYGTMGYYSQETQRS